MDLETLSERLRNAKNTLQTTEATMKRVSETLSHSYDLPEDERLQASDDFFTHLKDYEKTYETANDTYKQGISGLSEAYLSLCPLYLGPNLPKSTFLDSSKDIQELYALFLCMGAASLVLK